MHLRLMVKDIDMAEAELRETGVELTRPRSVSVGLDGNRDIEIEEPDGRQLKAMERASDRLQALATAGPRAGAGPLALLLS